VFEFNGCRSFRFTELRRLQRDIMQRTKHAAADETKYRQSTGCTSTR